MRPRLPLSCRATSVRNGEQLEPRCVLASSLVISEFMASNDGFLLDGFGNSPDWIELTNGGTEPLELQGYHLTDNPQSPRKWAFPARTLAPSEHLVVFASGRDTVDGQGNFHTNFSLRASGEFLALADPAGQILFSYGANGASYPQQVANHSYGFASDEPDTAQPRFGYMALPTPGGPNVLRSELLDGIVGDTRFSVDRGVYDQPIRVAITTETPESRIRYTLDGSAPSAEHGELYTGPIEIARTTVLRAIAFRPQWISTNVDSQTYLFLDDVIAQDGAGLPTTWGTFPFGSTEAAQGSPVPANYAMDPEVVNDPRYRDTIRDDLRSLPILSLSMAPDDLWDESTGIYSNPVREGITWERPVSVELFDARGQTEFQIDAGIRIHGGFGRRPSATAKHSFRLFFRNEYGAGRLDYPWFGPERADAHDTIVLRANYNYSWARGDRGGAQTGKDYTMITDRWAAIAQQDMGGLAPSSAFVHLFVNGLYWGVYNPTERPDAAFQASYRGGAEEDYDVMNHEGLVNGERDAWNQLLRAVRQRPLDLDAVEEQLDLDAFIDYMILNQFGGNDDWPHNNWYASRRRAESETWQFHSWDAEFFFVNPLANRISSLPTEGPGLIYGPLRSNPEFRMRFADRIYVHFFHGGALTPERNIDRLDRLAAEVDRAIVAESARWGDAWMDQVSPPRTRDDDWIPRLNELRETYFPERHETVLSQYRRARLYPELEPPLLNQHGGPIGLRFPLMLEHARDDAVLYFTRDGSDPRLAGGDVNPMAVAFSGESLPINPGVQLKARAWADGEWSALVDVFFSPRNDLNHDHRLDAWDIDLLCQAIRGGQVDTRFDVNQDGKVDTADQVEFVQGVMRTTPGDANLDGIFDSSDLVAIFQAGFYRDAATGHDAVLGSATWATGDWNCDGAFTSADLVAALQASAPVQAVRSARSAP